MQARRHDPARSRRRTRLQSSDDHVTQIRLPTSLELSGRYAQNGWTERFPEGNILPWQDLVGKLRKLGKFAILPVKTKGGHDEYNGGEDRTNRAQRFARV